MSRVPIMSTMKVCHCDLSRFNLCKDKIVNMLIREMIVQYIIVEPENPISKDNVLVCQPMFTKGAAQKNSQVLTVTCFCG